VIRRRIARRKRHTAETELRKIIMRPSAIKRARIA
jgi:hypothetical protein